MVYIDLYSGLLDDGKLWRLFSPWYEKIWDAIRYGKFGSYSKIKPEYYLLWGNDQDLNNRGITHLRTASSRAVSERSALKRLHEAHKAMEFVTFKTIHD